MLIKKGFLNFEPIYADLASTFAKSGFKCKQDPKKIKLYIKNAEFYADFKTVEKLQKKSRDSHVPSLRLEERTLGNSQS
jgi:hypothetical protein